MKPEPPSSSATDEFESISNNMIPMISSDISTGMPEKWEGLVPTEYSNNIIANADNYLHKVQTKTRQPLEKQNFTHHQQHHSSITLEKKAIVSGAYAAVIMFLFILTMFCAFRKISSKLRGGGTNDKADYLHQISVNIEER